MHLDDVELLGKVGNQFFYEKYGYSFDWAVVFRVATETERQTPMQRKYSVKNLVRTFNSKGFETSQFYSVKKDAVICKIRARESTLREEARETKYKPETPRLSRDRSSRPNLVRETTNEEQKSKCKAKKRGGPLAADSGGSSGVPWRPSVGGS